MTRKPKPMAGDEAVRAYADVNRTPLPGGIVERLRRRFDADLDPDHVRYLLRDAADALESLEAELDKEQAAHAATKQERDDLLLEAALEGGS